MPKAILIHFIVVAVLCICDPGQCSGVLVTKYVGLIVVHNSEGTTTNPAGTTTDLDEKYKCLMCEKHDGNWTAPYGEPRKGEQIYETARRVVNEKTGCTKFHLLSINGLEAETEIVDGHGTTTGTIKYLVGRFDGDKLNDKLKPPQEYIQCEWKSLKEAKSSCKSESFANTMDKAKDLISYNDLRTKQQAERKKTKDEYVWRDLENIGPRPGLDRTSSDLNAIQRLIKFATNRF